MQSPRKTILVAIAALIAIGIAWPAHGAVRSAPPQEAVVSAGGLGGATVTCPEGARVLSGGFESQDFTGEGSSTVRTTSMRAGKRGWRVDAVGLGNEAGSMLAHAYCEKKSRARIRARTASAPIGPDAIGGATATCLGRERAISGGFASPGFDLRGGSHLIALTSRRAGKRAWHVDAVNPSFGEETRAGAGTLVAYVLCRQGGPKLVARSATTTVAGNLPRTVDAYCPPGSEAISGGFDGSLVLTEQGMSASGAISSVRLPVAVGWRNTVISVADGAPATATVFAYCQRG